MATGDVKRKLTAIFSADVEGYSSLMEEDELATIETLTSHKEIMTKLIRQYRGRVVDSTGDNLLAEFASVVDAVQCAVEVQQVLSAKNETLLENRRMYFRIGINLGDVVEEGERIYGDGVNVAARVESLAEGGGISISGTAYDQLGKKLPLGYEYLGEQSVKNITKPVRVYRVLTEEEAVGKVIGELKPKTKQLRGVAIGAVAVLIIVAVTLAIWNFYLHPPFEPASVEKMAFPLPDEPSIAVLPFTNMSGDPEQEYLGDGLTEQIIISLSMVPRLFVIAHNSTFTYKGKAVKVQQVAEELGVRYVLEGSVQKSGERIRISAQLIDALTARNLWAKRYDRDLKDLFALQDEIIMKIISAIQVKLTKGDIAVLAKKETDNLEAYIKYLQAGEYLNRRTKEGNIQARKLAEEAIALDPEYPGAYTLVGWTHIMDVLLGLSKSPRKTVQEATRLIQKALAIDESHPLANSHLAFAYAMQGQHEKSLAQAERAVALNPNRAVPKVHLGAALFRLGRYEEAIQSLEKAIRIDPKGPDFYFIHLGHAYCFAGRYEEAIAAVKKAIEGAPHSAMWRVELAAIYSLAGRLDEARAEAAEVLKLNPKFSLEQYGKAVPWRKAELEPWIAALRKAGLPETPPLPLPDKPSIAVLPFVNMSGDPEQEYLSDGITEAIITALSKVEKLFVIARNSTFTYKGKPVKVQQVARDLGVQYILEGSVQKSADRIRITAQLIDAPKGYHLWAERYDRDLKDLFALQDEITMKIITALEVKLTEGEQALVAGSGTHNLDAYLKILQARDLKRHQTIESNYKARRLVEEAIKLDPDYAQAYRWLSGTYLVDVWLGSTKSPQESLRTAMELAKKAISLDDSLGGAHGLLGNLYIMTRQYGKGIREAERAVELEPNGADAHAFLGMGLRFAGRPEEAIPILKKAIRLDPHAPGWYLHVLAGAYSGIENYEEALEWGEKAVQQNPKNVLSRVMLCSIYSLAGRMDEARAQAKEIMRLDPNTSVERIARTTPQKNEVLKKRFIDALRKAGLPE